jgi:hypothetical protein
MQPGTCIAWGTKNPDEFFWLWAFHSSLNMTLDIIVYLLPIPFLSMLRLEGKSKYGIIMLFAMGGMYVFDLFCEIRQDTNGTSVVAVSIGRMISLVVNRAGSVPVVDMTYHTPTVYIIAILCASTPIFWPMIASFTSNKILVVNEISVLVEEYPKSSLDGEPGIGLAEQGAWRYDDGKDSPPLSPEPLGRKPSLLSKKFKPRGRGPTSNHGAKASVTSYDLDVGRPRASQESQNRLYRTASAGNASSTGNSSVLKADYAWLGELDSNNGSKTTTKVERVPVPYDHLKTRS